MNINPAALDLTFDSDAGEGLTIREYFQTLLLTLWHEGEGFSGKRPFGNSGWEYDLYKPLIEVGFITGEVDKYGGILEVDNEQAHEYVQGLIEIAFQKA